MVGYSLNKMPQRPAWLEALLTEKFFVACPSHSATKKSERNVFCVDCSYGICQHCLAAHQSHRLLQVRRYVYHDVIRLQDIQKFVDCALVQTYIINSARVVFLNQRPQPRPSRGFGNSCETCERSLQDAYRYCSLACKVDAVVCTGNLSSLAPRQGSNNNVNAQSEDLFVLSPAESLKSDSDEEMSPNSVLEDANSSSPTSSGSTGDDESMSCGFADESSSGAVFVSNANPPMKKFRKFLSNIDGGGGNGSSSSSKHRKGVPHRSPLW